MLLSPDFVSFPIVIEVDHDILSIHNNYSHVFSNLNRRTSLTNCTQRSFFLSLPPRHIQQKWWLQEKHDYNEQFISSINTYDCECLPYDYNLNKSREIFEGLKREYLTSVFLNTHFTFGTIFCICWDIICCFWILEKDREMSLKNWESYRHTSRHLLNQFLMISQLAGAW